MCVIAYPNSILKKATVLKFGFNVSHELCELKALTVELITIESNIMEI